MVPPRVDFLRFIGLRRKSVPASAPSETPVPLPFPGPGSIMAVTGRPETHAGKTTVVANTGLALARLGRKVLVIDADLSKRELLKHLLAAPPRTTPPNFMAMINHPELIRRACIPVTENLAALEVWADPRQVERFPEAVVDRIQGLASAYDYVLIDCPPPASPLHRELLQIANECVVVSTVHEGVGGIGALVGNGRRPRILINRAQLAALATVEATVRKIVQSPGAELLGIVPEDDRLLTAVGQRAAAAEQDKSAAWHEFDKIARFLEAQEVSAPWQRLIDHGGTLYWGDTSYSNKKTEVIKPVPAPPAAARKTEDEKTLFDQMLKLLDAVWERVEKAAKARHAAELEAAAAAAAAEAAQPPRPEGQKAPEPQRCVASVSPSLPVQKLPDILVAFRESLYVYEPKDIEELHWAMHSPADKHFLILYGPPGTGKSSFAKAYTNARYGLPLDAAENPYFRMIPVDPTWRNRSALLGYYDRVSEQYVMRDFLEMLLRATQDPEHDYVVCLDEMNLAVVEHYMADMLSSWESGEPIRLHMMSDRIMEVPERVAPPPNFLVVGTVNVDETVHQFSPRLIERAYTVRMAKVDLGALGTKMVERSEAAGHEALVGTLFGLLTKIQAELEPAGLTVSYRTAVEVVKNALQLARQSESFTDAEIIDRMLARRVFPRLRGGEQLLPVLDQLVGLTEEHLGLSADQSQAVAYLLHQKQAIETDGFSRFGS